MFSFLRFRNLCANPRGVSGDKKNQTEFITLIFGKIAEEKLQQFLKTAMEMTMEFFANGTFDIWHILFALSDVTFEKEQKT